MNAIAPGQGGGTNHFAKAARDLMQILENRELYPVFQPILSLENKRIYGYEALARGPEGSKLHSPQALFEVAGKMGNLLDLDFLARERAIERFCELDLPGQLFINVCPQVLMEPDFRSGETQRYLDASRLDPARVIIELTEHAPVADYDLLRRAVRHYRDMGFTIALDDLGSGYSGLRQWSELAPDFVKVDRHFVQNVHKDGRKRQLLFSIYEIAHALGCTVVAEGVEAQQELEVVQRLGVGLVQGYYFAPPQAEPAHHLEAKERRDAATQNVTDAATQNVTDAATQNGQRSQTVATLVEGRPTLAPATPLNEVVTFLQDHPELDEVAVVHHDQPVGLVSRSEIMGLYTSRFGRDLYGRRPVRGFMDPSPRIVSDLTPVESLSWSITTGPHSAVKDDFIITDSRGYYVGMGTMANLLHKVTQLQIRNASYANPLTQLPGNVPINDHMDDLIAEGEPFVLAYCDLDHFKPFNDIYGYAAGDEVIRQVGDLLTEVAVSGTDFVGHVGGDDFIVVWRSPDWEERLRTVLDRFGEQAPAFYSDSDRERGGIEAADRTGAHRFLPILSLSIGATPVPAGRFSSHTEISSEASEVKHAAKEQEGNALFIDRRHGTASLQRIPPAAGEPV